MYTHMYTYTTQIQLRSVPARIYQGHGNVHTTLGMSFGGEDTDFADNVGKGKEDIGYSEFWSAGVILVVYICVCKAGFVLISLLPEASPISSVLQLMTP
jgi:hypothetical protein